jgi:two-component system response regulator RegX3
MRILIVEDEQTLREGLVDLIRADGHEVDAVGDGLEAVTLGTAQEFDLVILDLMLPGLDGVEVARELRQIRPGVLILMLTARSTENEKVEGLTAGADDYMTKPFGARELLARVQALARRTRISPSEPEIIEKDGCRFDLGRCEAQRDDHVITLTAREAGIIRWLKRHHLRAVSRAELLEQLWSVPGSLETRTVDMTIANLRKKIERDPSQPNIIVSVKGVGYAWGEL